MHSRIVYRDEKTLSLSLKIVLFIEKKREFCFFPINTKYVMKHHLEPLVIGVLLAVAVFIA